MLWNLLTCLLLWIASFPAFALRFHDLSYVGLLLLVWMCFTWEFFPSLGTLEEFSLENFFPSFSFILLSSISSTNLLIPLILHLPRHWDYTMWSCLRVWSLFLYGGIVYLCTYLLILKKSKKDIFQKNSKIWYISKKNKKMIYFKHKKMIKMKNPKKWYIVNFLKN